MAANIFRSERLVYRAIENTEKEKAFIHSLRSDTLGKYSYISPLPMPDTKESIDSFTERRRTEDFLSVIAYLPVALENTETEVACSDFEALQPIGMVNLHEIFPHLKHHRTTDIGVWIASKYQGQGYGSEAIKWILGWGFGMAGLHRVGISAYSHNARAWKLYERLGFVLEGRKREAIWFNDGWHDVIYLGMLESEWRAKMKQKELGSDEGSISVDGWSEADLVVGK